MSRVGPKLTVSASCSGCVHERSEHYAVQGDSGHNVTCAHPSSPGRHIGDTTWSTPSWCPEASTSGDPVVLRAKLDEVTAAAHRLLASTDPHAWHPAAGKPKQPAAESTHARIALMKAIGYGAVEPTS